MSQKQVVTRPGGTVTWTRDATANDSDKTFTVPAGKQWEMLYVEATLTTTATVGNRRIDVAVSNATPALVWKMYYGGNTTASDKGTVLVQFGIGLTLSTTNLPNIVDGNSSLTSVNVGAPRMILTSGMSVRVWDAAAVDAAADDLTVVLHYIEYEA